MVIELKNIGQHIVTKYDGAHIREKTVCALKKHQRVEFDFNGVISLSDKFASECFGELMKNNGRGMEERIGFKNMSPSIKIKLYSCMRSFKRYQKGSRLTTFKIDI